jgi:hypothetical protein
MESSTISHIENEQFRRARACAGPLGETKGEAFLGPLSAAGAGTGIGLWLLKQLIVPGRFLMRVLAMALVTIAAASAISPAQAQTYDPRYPVCLQIYQGYTDYYFECGYTSLAQCNMSASGRSAQCIVNPYYAGGKARRDRRQRQPN